MTEGMLIIIIGSLCSNVKDIEIRKDCIEYHTNCIIDMKGIQETKIKPCNQQWRLETLKKE